MEDIAKLYEGIRSRFGMPDFRTMDLELGISDVEEEHFSLRFIREKVVDRLESAIKILDGLLQPDAGFAAFREANVFADSDHKMIVGLYKRLMFLRRAATELEFDDSDERNAEFIRGFMDEWPGLKEEVLTIVRRLKESWKEDVSKKEVVGYLG